MQNKKNPNLEMSLEKGIFCIKFFNEQPKSNHNMTSNNEGYSSNFNVPHCVCHCKYDACTKDSYFMKAREINRKQNPKETKNRKQIKQSSSRKIQKQSRKTLWLSDSLRWDQRIIIHLYFILNNTETIHRMWAHKCMCCSRSHHLGSCFVCWKLEKKKKKKSCYGTLLMKTHWKNQKKIGFCGMGIARNESKIEGWLYAILVNRIGMQISRKRYFILLDNCLNGYKMVPSSEKEVFFIFLFFFCTFSFVLFLVCLICSCGLRFGEF